MSFFFNREYRKVENVGWNQQIIYVSPRKNVKLCMISDAFVALIQSVVNLFQEIDRLN